jgi:protein-tyrosine phosphatase
MAGMRSALLGLVLALGGCALEDQSDLQEGDLTTFSVALSADGANAWTARVGTESLRCEVGFEDADSKRLACKNGKHLLELVVAGADSFAVDWTDGRRGSKRSMHTCTTTGRASVPSTIKCKPAPKRPSASGGLSSPFESQVAGLPMPNAHVVGTDNGLLRSMAPRTVEERNALKAFGIGAVLVFKNKTGNGAEVDEEMEWLSAEGITVAHIPFVWKDLPAFKESCEQTVDALKFLQTARKARKKTLFHCTVGEDRTGYLAAMERLLAEGGDEVTLFQQEMCERGYGAGNPQKPGFVVGSVEGEMTPLYRKMAKLVADGKLTEALSKSACATEPQIATDPRFVCGTSTQFKP